MSSTVYSGIFTDLLNYYNDFTDDDIDIIVTVTPIEGADIYHYHRPHLEKKLLENSVVTVHHDINDVDEWLNYEKFHERYSEAKLVFCLNTNQQNILREKGIKHTVLIPHGYNNKIFLEPKIKTLENEKINIGLISKRYGRKVKGEAYLYELMKRLDTEKFKFTFVGADRSISAFKASELGFETKCYERLPYVCFGDLYKNIHFLLMASLHEGGPANIPEAITSATPILATKVGMATDYINDKKNGLFLSGNYNIDALLLEKHSSKINYEILAKGAWQKRNEALTWQEVMKLTSKHYKTLVQMDF
jgi:glycosyltransferase involved in cell wall biosynthesis